MRTSSPPTATLNDSVKDRAAFPGPGFSEELAQIGSMEPLQSCAAVDAHRTKARTPKESSTFLSLAEGAIPQVFR